MYGADYAWILHETMGPPWWQQSLAECSQWELEQAVENLIIVSSHNSIVGGASSISGLVSGNRFISLLLQLLLLMMIKRPPPSFPIRMQINPLHPSTDQRHVPHRVALDGIRSPAHHVAVRPTNLRRGLGHGFGSEGRGGTVARKSGAFVQQQWRLERETGSVRLHTPRHGSRVPAAVQPVELHGHFGGLRRGGSSEFSLLIVPLLLSLGSRLL